MKKETISRAVGEIGDDLIAEVTQTAARRVRRKRGLRAIAVAACLCLLIVPFAVFLPEKEDNSFHAPIDSYQHADQMSPRNPYQNPDTKVFFYPNPWGADFSNARIGDLLSAVDLLAGYPRESATLSDLTSQFMTAMADFSFDLFRASLPEQTENFMISPTSVAYCLGMLENGAGGETRAQLETMFGMDTDTLNQMLFSWGSHLTRHSPYATYPGKVTIADSVWFRDDGSIRFKDSFLSACSDWYDADLFAAPFNEQTQEDINRWTSERTDGMIDRLLEEPPSEDSVMYLINTLFFRQTWSVPYLFDSQISLEAFTNADGSKVNVELMRSAEEKYICGYGAQGFIKPYQYGYEFVALLPDDRETDIFTYAESLTGEKWMNLYYSASDEYELTAYLPAFKCDASIDLTKVMPRLGVTDMLLPDRADLSGISDTPLFVGAFVQKNAIELDRSGTQAAAATEIHVNMGGMPSFEKKPAKEVRLDRPFVYAIVDGATGLPLFLGVVADLS